jgi:mRNA-degrading endonuclease RelE of RelBE toxin-antitoxin system
MKVEVRITQSFKKAVKPLLKKHPSLAKDLLQLEADLVESQN